MEHIETGRKQKQNITRRKEFYNYGKWNGHTDI